MNVSRWVYNWTRDFISTCCNWSPNWMEIKKYATILLPEWTKDCPFQIKAIAIKEATAAFYKAKGKKHFRSRKEPEQTCFIPSSAIKESGLYPRVSGQGLRYSESLPESLMDSRLIWKAGRWYLALPIKQSRVLGENQARVVAIDPGVRTFAAFYSTDACGLIGQGDFSRIQRLAHYLDDLISRMAKCSNKQMKRRMRLAAARLRQQIRNLIDELHHKTALFLVKNFDHILLPTFETGEMVLKAGRKIRNKTARAMLSFAHYRFKMFLKHKAKEYGKLVQDVCEAYTSKTHPENGEVRHVGGAKYIKLLNGERINRDLVGARNILLRALVDTPDFFEVAITKAS